MMMKMIWMLILSMIMMELGFRLLNKMRGSVLTDKMNLDMTMLNFYECGYGSYYPSMLMENSSIMMSYYMMMILLMMFDIEIAILLPLFIYWNIKLNISIIMLMLIIYSWYYELFIGMFSSI